MDTADKRLVYRFGIVRERSASSCLKRRFGGAREIPAIVAWWLPGPSASDDDHSDRWVQFSVILGIEANHMETNPPIYIKSSFNPSEKNILH